MPSVFRNFQYSWTFSHAAWIRNVICNPEELSGLVDVNDFFSLEDIMVNAFEPRQNTLLHIFIRDATYLNLEYSVRKSFASVEDAALELQQILKSYDVAFRRFSPKRKRPPLYSDPWDAYLHELLELISSTCLSRIVDEIFTVLFSDRGMLIELGKVAAKLVKKAKQADFPNQLERDGIVKRCGYWPKWLTDGLIYRDRGRCALCLTDIFGLLAPGPAKHLDHMIPLALGGTNDPTNLQFLCPPCNNRKAISIATSGNTSLYWSTDDPRDRTTEKEPELPFK